MRFVPLGLRLLALLVLGWAGAFVWFLASLPAGDGGARTTDGIVALTGGPARLDEAAALLAGGKARRMLISGVNQDSTAEAVRQTLSISVDLFDCCVDLGRDARDTVGNGRETADWVQRNGFRSLRVVTFAAHMPRSLVELRAALPDDIDLVPHPVLAERTRVEAWAQRPAAAYSLAYEFTKYLVALARQRAPAIIARVTGDIPSEGGR